MEIAILIKTAIIIPFAIAMYRRGWYDYVLPNCLKRFKKVLWQCSECKSGNYCYLNQKIIHCHWCRAEFHVLKNKYSEIDHIDQKPLTADEIKKLHGG